jgi:hypothetical protein
MNEHIEKDPAVVALYLNRRLRFQGIRDFDAANLTI